MIHWFYPLLAQATPGPNCADPSALVPVAAMVVIFYLVMILPQQREQKKKREMLSTLKKGDQIVTASGLFGKVIQVGEKDVVLEVALGGASTKVRWVKSQIAGVVPEAQPADAKSETKNEAKSEAK